MRGLVDECLDVAMEDDAVSFMTESGAGFDDAILDDDNFYCSDFDDDEYNEYDD